jgi:polyisoprenoid-binding protein YceI
MAATMPGQRSLPAGLPRPTAGSWRVDPARSQASFAARAAGRPVAGRLPPAGRVLMAEPIEDSTVRLAARTSAISTGSPWLDGLLAGPGFLDAEAFRDRLPIRAAGLGPGRMAGRRPPAGQGG